MIFESHAHYDDEAFDEDRESLLISLAGHGIDRVINVGASLAGCRATLELMEKYPFVYGAMGVHPGETEELSETGIAWLREQCSRNKVVAVGEIGLDYYWDEPSQETQRLWFARQLELARAVKKPVIIHSRDAAQDTYDMLKAHCAEEIGGVIHCYSYSAEMARAYVKMGFYIGVGGVVTFKNGRKLREVVEAVPIERIVLETDSPYLTLEPNRGSRNSSLHIPYIAQRIAGIKGMSYEEVVSVTGQNARQMYRIET